MSTLRSVSLLALGFGLGALTVVLVGSHGATTTEGAIAPIAVAAGPLTTTPGPSAQVPDASLRGEVGAPAVSAAPAGGDSAAEAAPRLRLHSAEGDWKEYKKKMEAQMIALKIPQNMWEYGNVVREQVDLYAIEMTRPNVRTICETGFFRGASAIMFLTYSARPDTVIQSFELKAIDGAEQGVLASFPGRLKLHVGSSLETVPALDASIKCDIIHVDGDHNGYGPYLDIVNLRPHAACGHVLMADDCFECPDLLDAGGTRPFDDFCHSCNGCDCERTGKGFCNDVSRSWARAVKEGLIRPRTYHWLGHRAPWGEWPKGFCIGEMVMPPAACPAAA